MEGGLGEFSGSEVDDTHPEGRDKTQGLPPEPVIKTASEVLGAGGIAAMQGRTGGENTSQDPKPDDLFDRAEKPSATRGLTSRGVSAMSGEVSEDK